MLNSQSSIAYYFFGWFCLFCFWIIPGNTQALLLVLYSEIISGSAQETRWDSTWVGHMQSKCLTCCAINLGPSITFLFVFRAHPSVCFGVTPGSVLKNHSWCTWGAIWDMEDRTGTSSEQGKCLAHCTIALTSVVLSWEKFLSCYKDNIRILRIQAPLLFIHV